MLRTLVPFAQNKHLSLLQDRHALEFFGLVITSTSVRNNVSGNHIVMGNDAKDIGVDSDNFGCQDNYGTGNSTYNVGSNDIAAGDTITINDV